MVEATGKLALFMYFDADDEPNGLEQAICQNVLNMTAASLSDKLEIYVYLDRRGEDTRDQSGKEKNRFDNVYNNWIVDGNVQGGSMYGKVVKDEQSGKFIVQWDTTIGRQVRDSSLSSTLGDFMTWATRQTTASHYVVWMSDHGNGVAGGFSDAAIYENTMLPKQYAAALKPYSQKLDVIAFDACLMANAEALGALTGVAKYVVSSEEIIGNSGYDYTNVFNRLATLESLDAQQIAQTIVQGNETSNSSAYTLSSVKLDDSLIKALGSFGTASANFKETDWTALIDAFHNPRYYYLGSYADLVELMSDVLAKTGISETLRNAATALQKAINDAVRCRKATGTSYVTEHGYGVMIYAPNRNIGDIRHDFAYLSMLQAGNDTPWSNFLYTLYQKAEMVDKVFRSMPDNALVNMYSGTVSLLYPLNETGVSEIRNVPVISLTDNELKHSGNYDINQESWLTFEYSSIKDSYSMNFTFSPCLNTKEIAPNSITINAYKVTVDSQTKTATLSTTPFATFTNTVGTTITVTMPSDQYQDKGVYAWQIVSEKAVTCTFEGNHIISGNVVKATEDRFDRKITGGSEESPTYGYHNIKTALKISTNYVGAVAVTKSAEDWFNFEYIPQTVEVIAGSTSAGAISKGALTVQLCRSKEDGGYTVKATAAEDATQTGKYTFSGVTYETGDFLRVSTDGDAACYYEVKYTAKESADQTSYNAPYLSGYIDATSVEKISGKDGSYALFWSVGHGMRELGTRVSYQWQLSKDNNFTTKAAFITENIAVKVYGVSSGNTYSWRVKTQVDGKDIEGGASWQTSTESISGGTVTDPQRIVAQNDYINDILMARANGTWESGYRARHVGFGGKWTGTREAASLAGKNKITDVFVGGGADSAILLLTDDNNGDAVFVDDIYSALPAGASGSRLNSITEVYAGSGNDVVDFTSQSFTNGLTGTEDKMILYGGDGNDVLWTGDTKSWLFGDDGNDQLAGSSKDDVLVGGSGNDKLFGCGGNDTFCFCTDWGTDVVYQLSGGSVTLWFQAGIEGSWDATTLTYTAGDNKISVRGVAASAVSVYVGDAHDKKRYAELENASAFAAYSTTKIFS